MGTETQEKKMVIFTNARISYGQVRPWRVVSYRDQYNRVVNFKDIGLYKPNGEPDMIPGVDGNQVQRKWDQILDFTRGKRSLALDPVIHKDVIQAIRDMPLCRSSKKSEGLPWVEHGRVFEEEPELAEQQQLDEVMLQNRAQKAFLEISQNETKFDPFDFDLICAACHIRNGSPNAKYLKLKAFVESNPQKFLDVIDEDSIKLKQEHYGPNLIKLAQDAKVLVNKNGNYYLEDINLGSRLGKIHTDHQNHLGAIMEAIYERNKYEERSGKKKTSSRSKAKSNTSTGTRKAT